ncbi:MAG: PD-(D/E)XK nuclease-like domain-containing protein [Pelagimonas sp.]|uniref:PD-(D/E)XK nuclease-like domain-containing protein n=1 Tax=Pelagimonas sp. TaxID=2073170 RepID=UPI003D6B3454
MEHLHQGEHDISDDLYFADPCPEPSLSATMAKDFIFGTPLHAWTGSQRLNPFHQPTNSTTFDLGSAFHTAMLSRGADIEVIDEKDWRSKAAKEARETARDAGKTPLLRHQFDDVGNMVDAARIQLGGHSCGDPFTGTDAELTLIWKQDGVWNRIKVDQIDRENRILYDLKTCAGYADPYSWLKTNMRLGIDIRVAHYIEGAKAVFGGDWRYRIIPVEKTPPHGLSVIELHPFAVDVGAEKVKRAREMLLRCLRRNQWPGYPAEICQTEPPAWFEAEWLERQSAEAAFKKAHGKDVLDFAFQMQAPAHAAE